MCNSDYFNRYFRLLTIVLFGVAGIVDARADHFDGHWKGGLRCERTDKNVFKKKVDLRVQNDKITLRHFFDGTHGNPVESEGEIDHEDGFFSDVGDIVFSGVANWSNGRSGQWGLRGKWDRDRITLAGLRGDTHCQGTLVRVITGEKAMASAGFLKFPTEPTPDSLYKPDGAGPFPAVGLFHGCVGIRPHIHAWAERLKEGGYVALVVDSFGPRGERSVCGNYRVSVDDVAGDALDAFEHLRTLPFVDKGRIGAMGFSYGAMAALRTASPSYRQTQRNDATGFRAIVAFYPACTSRPGAPSDVVERWNNLRVDTDIPILILIGDADEQTPADLCASKAHEIQKAGRSVSVKVYPGATHGFDRAAYVQPHRTRSGHIQQFDPLATADAAKMSAAFLGENMSK